MTKSIYFDSDCLSSFLRVNRENLLFNLYDGRICVPELVFDELVRWRRRDILLKINKFKANQLFSMVEIVTGSDAFDIYYSLVIDAPIGRKQIGDGEAAVIALAKSNDGIVASNNFRDIEDYIIEFNLEHLTTGFILHEAIQKELITLNIGNRIWASMISDGVRLPELTLGDFINRHC